ncbi:hypothetical protein Q31a_57200 [Aureliella helgolandensis]|uniref:Uncharacterized protein n=1 Tax=Aureliella helgolandensis TaxID=2527968 RepID=A0A518GFF2_9BACT|nr:hypothetical protein Q31a_57200 [Aureliella helgolandensis]
MLLKGQGNSKQLCALFLFRFNVVEVRATKWASSELLLRVSGIFFRCWESAVALNLEGSYSSVGVFHSVAPTPTPTPTRARARARNSRSANHRFPRGSTWRLVGCLRHGPGDHATWEERHGPGDHATSGGVYRRLAGRWGALHFPATEIIPRLPSNKATTSRSSPFGVR